MKGKDFIIRCGDCFPLMKTIKDNHADLVFTSPPYNRKRNDKYAFYSDTIDDYYSFLIYVVEESIRISKDLVILNIQKNYYNKKDVYRMIGAFSDNIYTIVYHFKTNPLPSKKGTITSATEMYIVFSKSGRVKIYDKMFDYILTSVNSSMKKEHKAVMRSDVCERFIKTFTKENDVVIDPFMGTGTTILECLKNNRKAIGIELVEEYYNISKNRILNYRRCNNV